jgi:uncharacterized protein (TIGR03437 family)
MNSGRIGNRIPAIVGTAVRWAFLAAFGFAAASAPTALAQTQDTSGNGLLNGSFRFRHVAVQNVDENFDPTQITASYGTITFNGSGQYTITGSTIDNTVSGGAPVALSVSGTYAIGSSGLGYISNPLYPNNSVDNIFGSVAQGVFTGSSTESEDGGVLNDIFVAIPFGAVPTNAKFTTSYQSGVLDFSGASSAAVKNALFELSPNGAGGFSTITLNGQASNQFSPTLSQTTTGATYNFNSDGSATLTFPLPAGVSSSDALLAGTRTMYVSGDGNFILGWTATGYDIFFGVKALPGAATNTTSYGTWFTTALENSPYALGTDSYYGSMNNLGDAAGDGLLHQRLNLPANTYAIDYGSDNQIVVNATGPTDPDFFGYEYLFGDSGLGFVAIGTYGNYSLLVGLHAPYFSGPGVYLSPTGVVNAANYLPPTASIAPGEMLTLFGTGLATGSGYAVGGQSLPTILDGVTVTINGIACPEISVYPGQISIIVPWEVALNQTGLANIQVTNNGVQSKVVQMYLSDSLPGAFSQTQNGTGNANALHAATYLPITPASPALAGETILLYLTGLGTVSPAVADGSLGPSNPPSTSDLFGAGNFNVYFDDVTQGSFGNAGTVVFAGLAPGFAGLYQVNVTVPSSGLGAGDTIYVEFVTDAADVDEIQIPFGGGTGSNAGDAQAALTGAAAPKGAKRTEREARLRAARIQKTNPPVHHIGRGVANQMTAVVAQ